MIRREKREGQEYNNTYYTGKPVSVSKEFFILLNHAFNYLRISIIEMGDQTL